MTMFWSLFLMNQSTLYSLYIYTLNQWFPSYYFPFQYMIYIFVILHVVPHSLLLNNNNDHLCFIGMEG